METNETQPNNPQDNIEMTNDELAAAMGFMTTIGDQQMMAEQEAQDGTETPESAPEQELALETEETPPIDPEALKNEILGEVEKVIEDKIGELKEMLTDALKDDDQETKNTSDTK